MNDLSKEANYTLPKPAILTLIQLEMGTLCAAAKIGTLNNNDQIATMCENFFIPILDKVLKVDLKNANELKMNQPGFDLVDTDKRTLVQVSVEDTKRKLNATKQKIKNQPEYSDYIFYFLCIGKFDKPTRSPSSNWNELTISSLYKFLQRKDNEFSLDELTALEKYLRECSIIVRESIQNQKRPKPVPIAVSSEIVKYIHKNIGESYFTMDMIVNLLNSFQDYLYKNFSPQDLEVLASFYRNASPGKSLADPRTLDQRVMKKVCSEVGMSKQEVSMILDYSLFSNFSIQESWFGDKFTFDARNLVSNSYKKEYSTDDTNPLTDILSWFFSVPSIASFMKTLDFKDLSRIRADQK